MKRQPKEIIKDIREKQERERKINFTFRFPSDLIGKFRDKCEKNEVSMTAVLEEMMQDFIARG